MEQEGFIKYIVIIAVILLVAFLSHQAYSWGTGKTFISGATDQASVYLSKGSNWVTSQIYSKISGEVQKRGDIIKTEINQEKEKISENILEKTKNYFSGVANSVLHPGSPQTCPVQIPSQTQN